FGYPSPRQPIDTPAQPSCDPSRATSSPGSVTGRSQTKPRQTYAVGKPSTSGRSASSGTPGRSGAPETITAPGGACRWAALSSSDGASWVATAISYGPESVASATAAA